MTFRLAHLVFAALAALAACGGARAPSSSEGELETDVRATRGRDGVDVRGGATGDACTADVECDARTGAPGVVRLCEAGRCVEREARELEAWTRSMVDLSKLAPPVAPSALAWVPRDGAVTLHVDPWALGQPRGPCLALEFTRLDQGLVASFPLADTTGAGATCTSKLALRETVARLGATCDVRGELRAFKDADDPVGALVPDAGDAAGHEALRYVGRHEPASVACVPHVLENPAGCAERTCGWCELEARLGAELVAELAPVVERAATCRPCDVVSEAPSLERVRRVLAGRRFVAPNASPTEPGPVFYRSAADCNARLAGTHPGEHVKRAK